MPMPLMMPVVMPVAGATGDGGWQSPFQAGLDQRLGSGSGYTLEDRHSCCDQIG
jgi:hypothetical protein